jgi:hypothetical protein
VSAWMGWLYIYNRSMRSVRCSKVIRCCDEATGRYLAKIEERKPCLEGHPSVLSIWRVCQSNARHVTTMA